MAFAVEVRVFHVVAIVGNSKAANNFVLYMSANLNSDEEGCYSAFKKFYKPLLSRKEFFKSTLRKATYKWKLVNDLRLSGTDNQEKDEKQRQNDKTGTKARTRNGKDCERQKPNQSRKLQSSPTSPTEKSMLVQKPSQPRGETPGQSHRI
ncbi:hypothetical protein Tco_0195643 [Tanacetum coccineum]